MLTLEKLLKKISYRFNIDRDEAEKFLCYLTESNFLEKDREEQDATWKAAEGIISNNTSKLICPNILPSSVNISKDILTNNNNILGHINKPGQGQATIIKDKPRIYRTKYDKSKLKIPSKTYVRLDHTTTLKATKEIASVIDFWNTLGLKKSNEGTKNHQHTIKQVRKLRLGFHPKSNTKFSYQEIKEEIKKFSLSVLDPNYRPMNGTGYQKKLKQMHLGQFIWQDYLDKSLFLQLLDEPLQTVHNLPLNALEDSNPVITQTLIKLYTDNILGGIQPEGGFLSYEKIKFITAAKRTVEFFDKNKDKMNLQVFQIYDPQDFAQIVWEAVEKDIKNSSYEVTPGFLSSDTTFHRRLPKYLYEEGLIDDSKMVMI